MDSNTRIRLCRHFLRGNCFFGPRCRFSHDIGRSNAQGAAGSRNTSDAEQGAIGDHPTLQEQITDLKSRLSKLSADKTCGICLDIVMEKDYKNRRFGLMPNCSHVYCLKCIGQWRHSSASDVDKDVKKCCPECRVFSEYVCPSEFYAEKKEDKDIIINNYRIGLSTKDCRKFRFGRGRCPFGNECFYKHALPNGKLVDLGRRPPKNRSANNAAATAALNIDSVIMSLTNNLFNQMAFTDDIALDLMAAEEEEDNLSFYEDYYDEFDFEDQEVGEDDEYFYGYGYFAD